MSEGQAGKVALWQRVLGGLQDQLGPDSTLWVTGGAGHYWTAHFRFNPPATSTALQVCKEKLPAPLPPEYQDFLMVHDGATLYYDNEYGQWGFDLYGTAELTQRNAEAEWREWLVEPWPPSYLVFGRPWAEPDLLIFDTARITLQGECVVVDGDHEEQIANWKVIARSFSEWLDHLVDAQGVKYWRWIFPRK